MLIRNAIAAKKARFIDSKRSTDIFRLHSRIDLGLGAGSAAALKYVRAKVHTQMLSNCTCNNLSLVVSPLPSPRPVQRYRYDHIHIFKMLGIINPLCQHSAEIPSKSKISVIFQLLSDPSIIPFSIIEKQCNSIGISFQTPTCQTAIQSPLYQGIELIRHLVMPPLPKVGKRQLSKTEQADILLSKIQFTATHSAHPRQQQIRQTFQPLFHNVIPFTAANYHLFPSSIIKHSHFVSR